MYKKLPFREHHILQILSMYGDQPLPMDLIISRYFRNHKAIGGQDRPVIADAVYGIIRWKGLLDFLCGEEGKNWENRLDIFQKFSKEYHLERTDIPAYIRASFPETLFDKLVADYGEEKAFELCIASNEPAPTTIRANLLKTTREDLLKKWKEVYQISATRESPLGITFHKKINFFNLPEFKAGFFEVQDEASQLVAALVKAEPGQHVLDYCAGSGGKTLAFAPGMQNKGQIYLHDIRDHILEECSKRLRRAGIQNCQVAPYEAPKLKKLKKKMDWVLVDAPCSGTGTLRRNPDMKWKYTPEMVETLIGQQRTIFEKALSFLKPGGKIVYATCSILKDENERQVEHFMKTYGLQLEGVPFQSLPAPGRMDGFFGAILTHVV